MLDVWNLVIATLRLSKNFFNPLCHLQLELGKMQKLVFRCLYEESFSTIPKTGILFSGRENLKNMIWQIPRFNPLKSSLCALKTQISKMQKLVCRYRYLFDECFSAIPKTISYFAAEKISKTWMSQIRRALTL